MESTQMNNIEQLKMRWHLAWHVLTGKYEPAAITPLPNAQNAKDECLKLALEALEALGERHHGGCRDARLAHGIISKRLNEAGVTL